MRRSHRIEWDLLRCCARTRLDRFLEDRIERLLEEPVDWDHLASLAEAHRVAPLVHKTLERVATGTVPSTVCERLGARFVDNARKNLFLTHELLRLLREFSAHGIPAVAYKGPVLAASVYGNLALRSFNDLDILVPRRHVLAVKDLLLAQGYRPEYELTAAQEARYMDTGCEYNFNSPTNIHVEVHWDILGPHYPFRPDPEVLWQRLGSISLIGRDVTAFGPEEMLLILSAHGEKHHWSRLSLVCDVAELVDRHQDLDWDQVLTDAAGFRCRRVLAVAIILALDLLQARVPSGVAARVESEFPPLLRRAVVRQPLRRRDGRSGRAGKLLMRLWVMDTAGDRGRHALHYITRTVQGRTLRGPDARLAQLERVR